MSTLMIHSDADLSAAVAEHVAGVVISDKGERVFGYRPTEDIRGHHQTHFYDFATSADAVLPLLGDDYDVRMRNGHIRVTIYAPSVQDEGESSNGNFPRAACIALLRAKGFDVVMANNQAQP